MSEHVVATAGHVDHGKSTLVRALTGIEPDRWAEERRRGLTIDLGFAWTALPSGRHVAFVDVPGHERFLGNMLAGLGPAPVVLFVVAADEGWRAQSGDHRDAVAALGIGHGLLVLTRTDRAPDGGERAEAQARHELAGTGLAGAPAVRVSAVTGDGLEQLRGALDDVLATVPEQPAQGRVRLWVDRAFSVAGAGAVVTGTLAAGALHPGLMLHVHGARGVREVSVRGLQTRGEAVPGLGPVTRAAVSLRGIGADQLARGDALLTPGQWPFPLELDVRSVSGAALADVPTHVVAHVGTAAVPARLRPLDDGHGRLRLSRPLPVVLGDRLVLRDPGRRTVAGGVVVLDPDPPPLDRRGAGRRWGHELATRPGEGDLAAEVARRGAVRAVLLSRLGLRVDPGDLPEEVRALGDWLVHRRAHEGWAQQLHAELTRRQEADPLAGGLSQGAARDLLGLPDVSLLASVVARAGLVQEGGRIRLPERQGSLGPAEEGVAALERRLQAEPFGAPQAHDLRALGLGERELAAAERAGRLIRVDGSIVLLPDALGRARRLLADLEQPFTASDARRALGTSRRVAIPLLEHLDGRGWTQRVDGTRRRISPEGAS